MAAGKTLEHLLPSEDDRRSFWPENPVDTYAFARFSPYPPRWLKDAIYGADGSPDLTKIDLATKRLLDLRIGRLPFRPHGFVTALLLGACGIMLLTGILLLRRRNLCERTLGLGILILLMNSILHALAQGMVTTLLEPRFGLPCILTLELGMLLTLVALPSLRKNY
jgi:hypothetical protein